MSDEKVGAPGTSGSAHEPSAYKLHADQAYVEARRYCGRIFARLDYDDVLTLWGFREYLADELEQELTYRQDIVRLGPSPGEGAER